MNRRNALKSCLALGAATGVSRFAHGSSGPRPLSVASTASSADLTAAAAPLLLANVALDGEHVLAAIGTDGFVNLNALGAHMGISVPTSCEAIADPGKLNQIRNLVREAQRNGAGQHYLMDVARLRRLGVPANLAALMRSGAASVSANFTEGVVSFA